MTWHYDDMSSFNPTRQVAFETLSETLDDLLGKNGVSEKIFAAEWLRRLAAQPGIIADGWYAPPPHGMAILFGDRTSYDTLRNPIYWPANRVIDWQNDLMFAYCSPISTFGVLGDIDVTLYFGESEKIRSHFRNTHKAATTILDAVEAGTYQTSLALVTSAGMIFNQLGLSNTVVSINDTTSNNIGHSFPTIALEAGDNLLKDEQKDEVSKARQFLNSVSDWAFIDGQQFSVEPQLRSASDPFLPQISYHYLAMRDGDVFKTCRDVDVLLQRFGLTV